MLISCAMAGAALAAEITFNPHKSSVPAFTDGASFDMKVGDVYGYYLTVDGEFYSISSDSTVSSSNQNIVKVSTFFTGENIGIWPRFGLQAVAAGTATITAAIIAAAEDESGYVITDKRVVTITVGNP